MPAQSSDRWPTTLSKVPAHGQFQSAARARVKEDRTARACRYSSDKSCATQGQSRADPRTALLVSSSPRPCSVRRLVADLGLHADQVERGDVDGSARAYGLRRDVEQLPVQVEARFGPHEVAGKHEPRPAAFCRSRAGQAAGPGSPSASSTAAQPAKSREPAAPQSHRPAHSRRAARARSPVGRSGRAELMKRQHHDRVLLRRRGRPTRETARLASTGCRLCASLPRAIRAPAALRGQLRDGVAGHADRVELQSLHHRPQPSRTSAAELKRAEGCFSRQRRITDSSSTGISGTISRRLGGSAELRGANASETPARRAGGTGGDRWPVRRESAPAQRRRTEPTSARDELLRRHVGDRAAACGIGCLRGGGCACRAWPDRSPLRPR